MLSVEHTAIHWLYHPWTGYHHDDRHQGASSPHRQWSVSIQELYHKTAMPTFNDLSYFDYFVLFIFLVFFLRGLWIGCVRQLATLLALVGGYFLAGHYAGALVPYTKHALDNPKATFLISYVLLSLLLWISFTLIGKLLHRFMRLSLRGWVDRLGGGIVGGVKAMVVTSLIYMLLASTLSTTNNLLRKSYSSPFLQQGADFLRPWIQDPRIQKHFHHKEPAIRTGHFPQSPPIDNEKSITLSIQRAPWTNIQA